MSVSRREFVVLTCAAAAGCAAENTPLQFRNASIDAGPVGAYAAQGVYHAFRNEGFFVVRRGADLLAVSAVCTHRRCKLDAEPDRSFYCHCHGSRFDPTGRVTEGPATRDLPILPTSINADGHLIVHAVPV